MIELAFLLAIPAAGALALALWGAKHHAPELNSAFSLGTFIAACALTARVIREGPLVLWHEQFLIDPFNVFLVTLTAFIGLTTSLFSRPYMRVEIAHGRVTSGRLRLYHSMYQLFMLTMLIALATNNMGLLWVAMEGATLSTVLLVTLYRTPQSLEAGWKYFILCGVGIAQALFGTILLYVAAERVLGAQGVTALLWTHLNAVKSQLEPTVLSLAFVFLLVGYGTKVGLAPLHSWLPDAHAEGPTPISAVLSGLLLNVALYAVVRCKVLVEGSLHSALPARMLMGFGLLSVVLAAFLLFRQRDIKRLFAYSSIEHMGIAAFGFGLSSPVATFAALLHMTVHSLTKSAIFFAAGHAAQKAGSQLMDDIRGLITLSPTVGWGLMLGALAILGLPPFGVFASEFLLLTTAMREQPWSIPILLIALGVAFAAIFGRVQPMVFGDTQARRLPHAPALLPVFAHLAIVLMLGVYIPPYLAEWYRTAAQLIGGS
ncbi:MAG TPA: hydrogenase 4 subunit F [Steroidobacteraceae bacterium]|nr:hydrogenase 4 subunit F [Steroidobacteraceae bacterium]